MKALNEPAPDLHLLSRIVKTDPSLCFAALALDRAWTPPSPSSGTLDLLRILNRIGHAGIDAIVSDAIAVQATRPQVHRQAQALGWLQRHALTTALLAQRLARSVDWPDPEEVYLAGLLHDLGKLWLLARTPAACVNLLADPGQAAPLIQAESQVAGYGHEHVGEWLIRRYTHAGSAADAARYHTADQDRIEQALPLVQFVWAANRLASAARPAPEIFQAVSGLLDLTHGDVEHLFSDTVDQVETLTAESEPPESRPPRNLPAEGAPPWHREIKYRAILVGVYRQLLAATSQSGVLAVLRHGLSHFPGIEAMIFLVLDPQRDMLVAHSAAGRVDAEVVDRLCIPLTATRCLPVRCHFHGQPTDSFAGDEPCELTIIDRQLMAALKQDALVCVPVPRVIDGEDGCLVLGIDGSRWEGIRADFDLLQRLIAAVGSALSGVHRPSLPNHAGTAVDPQYTRIRKIVHEINNPLSIIKNYLKVFTIKTDVDASGIDELRIVNEELDRMAALVQSLSAPMQTEWQPPTTVDVNATAADLVRLLQKGLTRTRGVNMGLDLDRCLPAVLLNQDLLKQALMNLLKNAAEATPPGGAITVSTRLIRDSADLSSEAGGERIRISVCDDGPGIDHHIRENLFRPFVSSKTGHDGLGLFIVREAVEKLGGTLRCEPIDSQGTCFSIDLPVGATESETAFALHSAT